MTAQYVIPLDVPTSNSVGYGIDYAGSKRNPLVHSVEMSVSDSDAVVRFTFYRSANVTPNGTYIQAASQFRTVGFQTHQGYEFSENFVGNKLGVYYVHGASGPFSVRYSQPVDCSDVGNSEFTFTFTAERVDAGDPVDVAVNIYTSED